MIASLVWKEYREQRSVWLALVVMGALVLVVLPRAYDPGPYGERGFREAQLVIAVALVWTYGLVCGAMLLAGEAEAGTQGLLDALPSSRLALWSGKLIAGGALVAGLAGLVAGLVAVVGLWNGTEWWLGGVVLAAAGPHGLVWGMASSGRARTVLGAVGLALLGNLLLVPALTFAVTCGGAVVAIMLNLPLPGGLPVLLGGTLTLLLPLPLSALNYTQLDRARRSSAVMGPEAARFGAAWRLAAWLSWRQMRGLVVGMLIFAIVAGCFVLSRGLVVWPVSTLAVGTLCGVTAFMDEQAGAYRYLGDQRFPLGRVWLVKVGARLALGLLVLVVMLVPVLLVSLAQEIYRPGSSRDLPVLVGTLGGPVLSRVVPLGVFFAGPMVTGFAVGHLVGLLFRKALVALVAAVGVGVVLVALWWPSMIAGGLHVWQVYLPPLVLLGGAWLLVPYWAGDRLVSWGAAARLAATASLALGLTGLGMWYRAVEFPDVGEPAELAGWEAGLPTPEENEAGRLVKRGLTQLHDLRQELHRRQPVRPLFPADGVRQSAGETFLTQAQEVVRRGWPKQAAELGAWLDEVFQHDWHRPLAEAAAMPAGTVEGPRQFSLPAAWRTYDSASAAGALLAARGLQRQQAGGDPAAFVGHLRTGLGLARHMRHNATLAGEATARQVERVILVAVERWLEGLGDRADLLRQALEVVKAHAGAAVADGRVSLWVEYVIARDGLDRPVDWLDAGEGPVLGLGGRDQDREVITAAWSLPWERARRERLVRLAYWGGEQFQPGAMPYLYAVLPNVVPWARQKRKEDHRLACGRAAVELLLALRLYQAENGRAPETLQALVPAYLPAVSLDPFTGQPFRYRVSKGEAIELPVVEHLPPGNEEAKLLVSAGQGVLWSVGEDRVDNGGLRQARESGGPVGSDVGLDLIWVVPMPAKPRR